MVTSKSPIRYFLFALLLIGIDQASKMAVHHFMYQGLGGQIKIIGDWFKLYYVTNPGMAFGMQIEHPYGKLFLTIFRLVAMVFITLYMVNLAKKGAKTGLLWSMAMILAGAIGNLIDSIFYGVLIGNAPPDSPTPWFHGQVIDMIFIDFWEGFIPSWVPIWGNQYYTTPIFNIADSCIFIGVCMILMFQGHFFPQLEEEEETEPTTTTDEVERTIPVEETLPESSEESSKMVADEAEAILPTDEALTESPESVAKTVSNEVQATLPPNQ